MPENCCRRAPSRFDSTKEKEPWGPEKKITKDRSTHKARSTVLLALRVDLSLESFFFWGPEPFFLSGVELGGSAAAAIFR